MRLGLSSAVAPSASLDELLAACARRGLGALELREEDAHGVDPGEGSRAGAAAAKRAAAAGIGITGYRAGSAGTDLRLARLAERLGAPVLLEDGPLSRRLDRGEGLVAVGARVAIVVRGERALEDAAAATARGLDLAWDVDPAEVEPAMVAAKLLSAFGARLLQIRLSGGGPETALHEGRGVGELMGRLALAGYRGALVLTPSSRRYRVAWEGWLGRRGGWGCGSRTADPSLVRLARPEESAAHAAAGGDR